MTEEREDDYLVIVRAQVMTRDESTEGWLPLAGGGLANVSIRKRARLPPEVGAHEYIIYGQRISDQTVILSCVINNDLQYSKVMPTFHHWRAGKQRNGLTFQTAADARAFDKGVVRAFADLIDGMPDNWSSPYKYDHPVEEDDVFMTLNLPMEPVASRTASEGSGKHGSPAVSHHKINAKTTSPPQQQHNIHIISFDKRAPVSPSASPNSNPADQATEQPNSIAPGDNYSYVQLTAVHDFNFAPASAVDDPLSCQLTASTPDSRLRRDSVGSLKKRSALDAAAISTCGGGGGGGAGVGGVHTKEPTMMKLRMRCRYCQEFYTEEWNRKGACDFAPDCFRNGLDDLTGIQCARCMLYHCMSDAEGDTVQHPCECTRENGCTKRWLGLTLLSLLVPCLCCYPPLRACHWVGVSCGICGGKHKPQI